MAARGKIGIFGGSFDPVHNGHMILAERAAEFIGLEKVMFIPTAKPPHKTVRKLTDFEIRRKMVELAIEDHERFELSLFEKKERVSFTFESVIYFKDKGYQREQLHLLLGGDSLGEISEWRNPEIIFKYSTIVSLNRPGYEGFTHLPEDAAVIIMDRGKTDISSTGIREFLRAGKAVSGMVPQKVERFIMERSLYREV